MVVLLLPVCLCLRLCLILVLALVLVLACLADFGLWTFDSGLRVIAVTNPDTHKTFTLVSTNYAS